MRFFHVILATIVSLAAPALHADWLVLKSGRALRGIDIGKQGAHYRITLESAETVFVRAADVAGVKKSPPGETVEHEGKQVTLRAKIRAVARERRKRDRRVLDSLAAWAREKDGAETAKDAFRVRPLKEQTHYLTMALREDPRRDVRLLAARELLGVEKEPALQALTAAAVGDSFRSVRDASLRTLQRFRDFDASIDLSGHFTPYLDNREPARRVRAANAISLFPSKNAVPALLKSMHLTWSGFGRGFFSQVTQRSYIADYELVSGGTGFAIVEVADPVVRTMQSGVALDVDVRKVELIARMRALVRSSGQDFGLDFDRWREWWKRERIAAASRSPGEKRLEAEKRDG